MSRKGPVVGNGMLDFVEDIFVGVKSQLMQYEILEKLVTLILRNKRHLTFKRFKLIA